MGKKIAALLLLAAVAAIARGRWDSDFTRVGTLTVTATNSSLAIRTTPEALDVAPPYVKVSCSERASIGFGSSTASCAILSDGGWPCDVVRGDLGEKFYGQMSGTQTHVAAVTDAGTVTCLVMKAVE